MAKHSGFSLLTDIIPDVADVPQVGNKDLGMLAGYFNSVIVASNTGASVTSKFYLLNRANNNLPTLTITSNDLIAIGNFTPTARFHLPAGTTAPNSGPLKLTAGPLVTIPEDGLLEYDGVHLYFTIGATRTSVL